MTKHRSRERARKNWHQALPFALGDADVQPFAWPKSAPPPMGCPLNDEGTQRILDKVGGRFVPHGLEARGAAGRFAVGASCSWCSLRQLSSDKIARGRVQRLEP